MGEIKRRTIPIIHRTYQYRFLAFTTSYMIVVIFFMAAYLFVPEFMQMTDPNASIEVQAMAADKILYGHSRMWPALIALVVLIGLHSLQVFARFVGPLYRFTRAFDKIQDGDLGFRVQIRKKDYLKDERDRLNAMIESLSNRIGDVCLAKDEIEWALKGLEEKVDGADPTGELRERLADLKTRVDNLNGRLEWFRLETPAESETDRGAGNRV